MGTNYGYKTRENINMSQSTKKSVVGQGKMADKDGSRTQVIDAVKNNLVARMKEANTASAKDAKNQKNAMERRKDKYNRILKEIRNREIGLKEIQEQRSEKEKNKANMEKDSSNLNKARARVKTGQAKVEKRSRHLAVRKDMMDKRDELERTKDRNLIIENGISMARGVKNSIFDKDGVAEEEEQRFINEKKQRENDQKMIQKYDRQHDMSAEKFEKRKQQLVQARNALQEASKELNPLEDEYRALSDSIEESKKREIEEKAKINILSQAFMDKIYEDERVWMSMAGEHRKNYEKYYNDYDDAAMKYYVLARPQTGGQASGPVQLSAEEGVAKDIQEYVGKMDILSIQPMIDRLHSNPEEKQEIVISSAAVSDGSLNSVEKHIKHHRGIKTTREDTRNKRQQSAKLDSSFKEKESHGPVTLDLTADKKDKHGFFINSSDTLSINTIKTKNKRTVTVSGPNGPVQKETNKVRGVFINGEFIPEDASAYSSKKDASFWDRNKVKEDTGTFAIGQQMAEDIRNSPFFDHIYSEMVEFYMNYHGDDKDLMDRIIASVQSPSNVAGQNEDLKTLKDEAAVESAAKRLYRSTNPASEATEVFNAVKEDPKRWQRVIFPRLVRLMLAVNDDKSKNILRELIQGHDPTENKDYQRAFNKNNFMALHMLCDSAEKSNKALESLKEAWEFFTGDGVQISDGEKGSEVNGLINWETIESLYENANSMWGLFTGRYAELARLENEIDLAENNGSSQEYIDKLNEDKESLESDIDHGCTANVLSLFNNVLGFFAYLKSSVEMCIELKKNKSIMSKEHKEEKDLGSLYVTWFDGVLDAGDTLLGLINSIFGIFSDSADLADYKFKGIKKAGDILDLITNSFNFIKSVYNLGQSAHKYHNISNAENTINDNIKNDVAYKEAADSNAHVLQFLASSRRKAGKDIAENSIDTVTSATDIASNVTDPVTSQILGLCSSFIGFLGKLITNGIYRRREEKAAFVAAFGEKKASKYMSYSDGDRILQETVGIKSRRHLAGVTRIMAAIDTHAMLKNAPEGSKEWELAKTAMGAFYKPKNGVGGKQGYDQIPFSALLGHVGEGDDWRAKLADALV